MDAAGHSSADGHLDRPPAVRTGRAGDETLADLRLRDFVPEPMVRLPEHRATRSPVPAVDVLEQVLGGNTRRLVPRLRDAR